MRIIQIFSRIFVLRAVTKAVLLENSSIFFRNFNSGASHRPFSWKTHPLKIMSTYSIFFNSGASHRPFYVSYVTFGLDEFSSKTVCVKFLWKFLSYRINYFSLVPNQGSPNTSSNSCRVCRPDNFIENLGSRFFSKKWFFATLNLDQETILNWSNVIF